MKRNYACRVHLLFLAAIFLGFFPAMARCGLPETIVVMKDSVVLVGAFNVMDNPRFKFRGTGFVVAHGNRVITNAHVLPGLGPDGRDQQVALQTWSSTGQWTTRQAKILAVDRQHDLALLGFDGEAVKAVILSDKPAKEGDNIAFMGFPIGGVLGFSHVTHVGIVSSVAAIALPAQNSRQLDELTVQRLKQGDFDIYQLDAVAYPGNSGGPIFDPQSGVVLGVINSVLVKKSREAALTDPSGISYGIPGQYILRLLRELE